MIDVVSGEEPPVELGEATSRSFGVPHPGWFFGSVSLQLVVLLLFMGASKLHAMSPATVVKVEAIPGYVCRDKFRGNYITDVIFNADAVSVLPGSQPKEVTLIFDAENRVSKALDTSLTRWKSVRIEPRLGSAKNLKPSEVALKAKVAQSRFQSGKQMIFINTSPFFISEATASSLSLKESSRNPVRFEIAVDKNGGATIMAAGAD